MVFTFVVASFFPHRFSSTRAVHTHTQQRSTHARSVENAFFATGKFLFLGNWRLFPGIFSKRGFGALESQRFFFFTIPIAHLVRQVEKKNTKQLVVDDECVRVYWLVNFKPNRSIISLSWIFQNRNGSIFSWYWTFISLLFWNHNFILTTIKKIGTLFI